MEKIKNLLRPGAKQDDEVLYGDGGASSNIANAGRVAGEGSHFPHAEDSTATGSAVDSNTTTDPLTTTGAQTGTDTTGTTGVSSLDNTAAQPGTTISSDQTGLASDNVSTTAVKDGNLGHETSTGATGSTFNTSGTSDATTAATKAFGSNQTTSTDTAGVPYDSEFLNRIDPRVPEGAAPTGAGGTFGGQHHAEPDAGVGGIGGSGVNETSVPATGGTVDPYSSSGTGTTTEPGLSSTDHHYGRDAAVVGGLGAAGYEAEKHHDNTTATAGQTEASSYPSTTGVSSIDQQTLPTSDTSAAIPPTTSGIESLDQQALPTTTDTSSTAQQSSVPGEQDQHHYGRDAAVVGGLGAAGYGAEKHHENTSATAPAATESSVYPESSGVLSNVDQQTLPTTATNPTSTVDSSTIPEDKDEHHYGRDAAVVGGAAGAAGLAEHHHSSKESEKEEKALEKEHEKELKQQEKEERKQEKAAEKEHKKELKQLEKEEKKQEKEEKSEEKGEKKHGGILGFFKRDKHQDTAEETTNQEDTDHTHKTHHKEEAALAGVGAAGLAEHEHGKDDRNRLHKDPPAGSAYDQTQPSGYTSQGLNQQTLGTTEQESSHLGRDAALGGVGVAGLAEAEHHHKHEGETGTGILGQNAQSDLPVGGNATHEDSHLGRDAALGGVGVAGLAEAEHHHHKHEGETATGITGQGAQSSLPVTDDTNVQSSLHDPVGLGYDGTAPIGTQSDLPVAENARHGDSHLGRDVALGGVGAAGLAEAENHHHKHEEQASAGITGQGAQSSLPVTDDTNVQSSLHDPVGLGYDGTAPIGTQSDLPTSSADHGDSHLRRDAAIGGVGAVGLAEAEHHHHKHEGETGTDITGQGVQSDLPTTGADHGDSHLGRDAAVGGVGAAGLAEAEHHHHKHEGETGTGITGQGAQSDLPTTGADQGDSHLGRDAAIGGVGVAGLAEAEHHHHHKQTEEAGTGVTGQGAQSDLPTTGVDHGDSHLGRDAAIGGAGAAGLAEAEHHHHEGVGAGTGPGAGLTSYEDQRVEIGKFTAPEELPAAVSEVLPTGTAYERTGGIDPSTIGQESIVHSSNLPLTAETDLTAEVHDPVNHGYGAGANFKI